MLVELRERLRDALPEQRRGPLVCGNLRHFEQARSEVARLPIAGAAEHRVRGEVREAEGVQIVIPGSYPETSV